jgi:hypothetical protein
MTPISMPAPLFKYLEPQFAKALVSEGSIKVGTLSEYRDMEGSDPERGDGHEGELTIQSPAGRHVYGGDPTTLPPPLQNPAIHIDPGALVTEGEGAITIHSKVCDLFIYCTTEAYDHYCGSRFGNGTPIDCVRINQPEQFFLELDAAFRAAVSIWGMILGEPRWGRCDYQDRLHNWERDDLPAMWLLKPAKFHGQHEVRVRWETVPMQPLKSIVLKVPAIIPYCTLLTAGRGE